MKNKASKANAKTPKHDQKNSKRAMHNGEYFGNHLSALMFKCLDGEFYKHPKAQGMLTIDDIEDIFAEVAAGYRAKFDGDDDIDTVPSSSELEKRIDQLEISYGEIRKALLVLKRNLKA